MNEGILCLECGWTPASGETLECPQCARNKLSAAEARIETLTNACAQIDGEVWRCLITSNPVGTDTEMIGRPCQCQICRLVRGTLAAAEARIEELTNACAQIDGEVCQILGKALGYPTEGPEVGGDHSTVCVGDHVAQSIAAEAVARITELESKLASPKRTADPPQAGPPGLRSA